jgi:hypothetical protein
MSDIGNRFFQDFNQQVQDGQLSPMNRLEELMAVRVLTFVHTEIDLLHQQLAEARALLSTACDAWGEGQWNSRICMQQLYLTRAWREEAERICGQR